MINVIRLIVITTILIFQVSSQIIPESPCPEVFTYINPQGIWKGAIIVRPPYRTTLELLACFEYDGNMMISSGGKLTLLSDDLETSIRVAKRREVGYVVTFPTEYPLPRVVYISLNNNMLCSRSGAYSIMSSRNICLRNYFNSTTVQDVLDNLALSKSQSIPNELGTYPCGKPKMTSRTLIRKGELTEKGEWPWAVGVFHVHVGKNEYRCGGTLVSKKFVITAGHCVFTDTKEKLLPRNIYSVIGLYDVSKWQTDDSKAMSTVEIILHPQFQNRNTVRNDIALLRFEIPLNEFTDIYIAACLWWPSDVRPEAIYGTYGTVVGWGKDENGQVKNQHLTMEKVVTLSDCHESNPGLVTVATASNFCAGNRNGSGPCSGDSGSGMYFYLENDNSWYLRGIVSSSINLPEAPFACNTRDYAVYVDIIHYLSWIEQNTL